MSVTSAMSVTSSMKEPTIDDTRDDQLRELRKKRDMVYPSLLSIAQSQVDDLQEELRRINFITVDLLASKELKRRESTDLYNSITLRINSIKGDIDPSRSDLISVQKEAEAVAKEKERAEKELNVLKQECKTTKDACTRSKASLASLLKSKEKYERKEEAASMIMKALLHPYNMELLHRTLRLSDAVREQEQEENENEASRYSAGRTTDEMK